MILTASIVFWGKLVGRICFTLAIALQKNDIQSQAHDAELDFDDYLDAEIENSLLDALA